MSEHQLYVLVAEYLQVQYPDVVYRFDLAADLKLTIGQARKHRHLHPVRGYPDLFIAEPRPRCIDGGWNQEWHGLYIEIKTEDNSPFKKDGTLKKDQHLEEQQEMLEKLEFRGYKAVFGVGFENIKEIIDEYMGYYE